MVPITYLLEFREAASRLRKGQNFRWKIHYLAALLESAHAIKTKGYDVMINQIFLKDMDSDNILRQTQFLKLHIVWVTNLTAINGAGLLYRKNYFLIELAKLFDSVDEEQRKALIEKFENDATTTRRVQTLLQTLHHPLQMMAPKIDLTNIRALLKRYYKKHVLFQEEAA